MPTIVNAFSDDALGDLDAVACAQRVREGSTDALALVEAAVARAQTAGVACNAIAFSDYDRARSTAAAGAAGTFGGVPTFVKDTDDVEGLPTTIGSRAVFPKPARADSGFVRQLAALGLVNLGKSTLPEFGLTGTTEPLSSGPTRNPWNTDHSSGGSSGGAAALVASGVVPIAHANDGGGSIRIPASCCGLVGFKATQGRLAPVDGSGMLPVRIVHQGVVTRSVRDTARFYQEIERLFGSGGLPPIGGVDGPGTRRLRIAVLTASELGPADGDCTRAARAAAALCEQMGHAVEEIDPPFGDGFGQDFFLYWSAMAFVFTRFGQGLVGKRMDRSRVEPFTEGLAQEFLSKWSRIFGSVRRLRAFGRRYAAFFDDYDVLLSPTLGHAPPRIGHLATTLDFETCMSRVQRYFPFTPYQNAAGAPAISLPISRNADNLPIGVQFAARGGADRLLLELAFEFEAASGWEHLSAAASLRATASPG